MNNTDFSKLLQSTDRQLLKSRRPKKVRTADAKAKRGRPKPKPLAEEKEEGPTWRDRAKERQAGHGEYKQVADEFEQHAEVSVDESKFLGGDMDHTHLVKGLDYALLGKVRAELGKFDRKEKARNVEQERRDKKKGLNFQTLVGRKVFQTVIDSLHPHHVFFQHRLRKLSKSISLGQRMRGAPAVFQPGHMMYEFDIEVNISLDDIPKFVTRSREECAPMDWSKKPGYIDGQTVDLLTTVLSDIKGRRRARKEAEEKKRRAMLVSKPEEDIFQSAGGFNSATERLAPANTDESHKSLFEDVMLGKKNKDFQAAKKFTGSKVGWVYKQGEFGLGYYREGYAAAGKFKRIYAKATEETDAYGDLFPNVQLCDDDEMPAEGGKVQSLKKRPRREKKT